MSADGKVFGSGASAPPQLGVYQQLGSDLQASPQAWTTTDAPMWTSSIFDVASPPSIIPQGHRGLFDEGVELAAALKSLFGRKATLQPPNASASSKMEMTVSGVVLRLGGKDSPGDVATVTLYSDDENGNWRGRGDTKALTRKAGLQLSAAEWVNEVVRAAAIDLALT